MRPNVPLLRKTLEHIEENPEQWHQDVWRMECGTAFCFAGWTAELSGAIWAAPADHDDYALILQPDGSTDHVANHARAVLGLTDEQASRLFWAINTLADLRAIVAELSQEDGTP